MEEEDDEDKHPNTTTTTTTTTTASAVAIVAIIFLTSLSTFTITATADDAAVMTKLSQSFNPPPPSWSGNNPCKWQGVSCDNSKRVISITVASQSISGTLPSEITQLSSLQTLSLQNNQLTGPLPRIANMSQLQELFLDRNLFSNTSPDFLVGLPSLQVFSITQNPLQSWKIPSELLESTSLRQFRASNANLVGSIPDIFQSFSNLKDLKLSYNDLTGNLPASFAGSGIENLWVNNQKQGLSGVLDVLGKMPNLVQVWVQDNSFVGSIPDLSNCANLFDLQLRDNDLVGVVPPSLSNLPKLANISLQNNKFQGPLPDFGPSVQVTLGLPNSFCKVTPGPCDPQVTDLLNIVGDFGYPSELVSSWTGNDACRNWPHVSCDSSGKVTQINFARRGWNGFVSPSFANLTSLTSIILSDNHFVGRIPEVLSSLNKLQKLDISNNNLTGKLPSFGKNVEVISNGNPFLGTDVDTSTSLHSPPGMSNSPLEGTKDGSSHSKSRLTGYDITGIVIGVLVFLIAVGFLLYPHFKKWLIRRVYESGPNPFNKGKKSYYNFEDFRMSPMVPYFAGSPMQQSSTFSTEYNVYGNLFPFELLREVTNNFDDKNILGRGGFGTVYRGVLQDGTQIAVKRMETNTEGTKGKNEFEAEILVLSKVRHRNLVALLGYCINGNERIMVYECMPQGTLGEHLFKYEEMGLSPLTWHQRLVIALDVARGVEYLHGLAQQSFIHRDLKPSNVLIGDDMRAKVSDFGLVKSVSDQGKDSMETRLAGTFGYLAPEYATTGRVTTKVDVFAYGIILMELITGRKALDESMPEDEVQLAIWFKRVLNKESIRKAMDPNLETDDDEIFESICKVAELAGHCTAREPQQRPDMSHAVNVLSPLVQQWRPTEMDDGDDWIGIDIDMSLPQALEKWRAGETMTLSDYNHTTTTK